MKGIRHIVSFSGGKDLMATLLIMLDKLMFWGEEAEKYATNRRFAQIRPGYTVAELDKRFALEDRQLTLA